jgi:hypothetical protein
VNPQLVGAASIHYDPVGVSATDLQEVAMFGKDGKLTESVVGLVNPGEEVLAAVAVQPKGAGNAMAVGGIAGSLIGGRGGKTTQESKERTGIDVPRWAALAVTTQRLLILKMNAMGTKADAIASEVPIAEVESIITSKSMLRRQVTLNARGGTFEFEAHKAAPVESLSEALAKARGG